MSSIQKLYNNYWSQMDDNFNTYPRNLVLPPLFREGETVLDIGCGDGLIGSYLQKECGIKVTGIDFSDEALKRAKKRGLTVKKVDVDSKLPFDAQSFDVVFWGDNIEHLFDPMQTAEEIERVLKKEGRLVMSTPNSGYWRYRLSYLLKGQVPDTEYNNLPRWSWTHLRLFNLNILRTFFQQAGFKKVSQVIGVSSRRIDKLLMKLSPELFGMILVLEVKKE